MPPPPPHPARPCLYGLDIETDTTVDGFDPSVAAVVSVAVSGAGVDRVFDGAGPGSERRLLTELDRWLDELPDGIIVTWNGAVFDLPFLADRAERNGVNLGLRLWLDPGIPLRRAPITGHCGAYRATWRGHRHLDAYRVYRSDVGPLLGVSCGLKSVARLAGLPPVEVDRARIHELTPQERATYVACDARLTRMLAERRWPGIAPHVDPR